MFVVFQLLSNYMLINKESRVNLYLIKESFSLRMLPHFNLHGKDMMHPPLFLSRGGADAGKSDRCLLVRFLFYFPPEGTRSPMISQSQPLRCVCLEVRIYNDRLLTLTSSIQMSCLPPVSNRKYEIKIYKLENILLIY